MIKLDGKEVSVRIQEEIKEEIEVLRQKTGRTPGLTVIRVGEDPASKIYVRSKDKMAAKLGVRSQVLEFDENISQEDLMQKIKDLNEDGEVDGVLVQTPLPKKINTWEVLDTLSPGKDADRFHPVNLGMVMLNRTNIFPCTPAGILKILDYYEIDLSGMDAVVIGRSFIVGKPMACMLTNRNATVTVCHSKTKDLAGIVRRSDLIIAAVGKPGLITADMVKEGAVLIDVGINRLNKEADVVKYCTGAQQEKFAKKGYGICGDIHREAYKKSSYYTPVPGGVGLMTVAMLMHNTLQLFKSGQIE
jgi:methylenetetrahydrofolate dehydrogenase (NADP+)/methenyltetrahydrofolate cyclohydrolase